MPIDRLTRTRASLADKGYQFGDAKHSPCRECGVPFGSHRMTCSLLMVEARAYAASHRADTLDPDGYGHAV